MNAAARAAYIKAIVDQAPPLTTEQQSRLRLLLQPAPLASKKNGVGPPTGPTAATDVPSPKETDHEPKPARAA